MEILKKNKRAIVLAMIILFIVGIGNIIYWGNKESVSIEVSSMWNEDSNEEETTDIRDSGCGEDNYSYGNDEGSNKRNIYVHIVGEVNIEGVIILEEGQRIVDAIEKAGGATEMADLSRVNLAFILSDGQMVRVPSVNDVEEGLSYVCDGSGKEVIIDGGSDKNSMDGRERGNDKVNINTATQTELESLDGIGPSLAGRIIEYREKNGKFNNVDELLNVSGIGGKKLEGIREKIAY